MGRHRSSRNATRHGLTAAAPTAEDAAEVLALADALAMNSPNHKEFALAAARAHFAVIRVRRATVEALDTAHAKLVADGGAPGSDAPTDAAVACVGTVRKYYDYERRALSRRKAALRRLEAEIAGGAD